MKKIILIMFAIVTIASCKKDDKVSSTFQGSYSGRYTGGDSGSINVDVDANGVIKGTSVSSKTLEVFSITGNVDNNGSFSGTTDIGTDFKGAFAGTNASGTFNNTSLKISGTWSVTKK